MNSSSIYDLFRKFVGKMTENKEKCDKICVFYRKIVFFCADSYDFDEFLLWLVVLLSIL